MVVAALVGLRKTVLAGKMAVVVAVARGREVMAATTSRAAPVSAVAKAKVAVCAARVFVQSRC